MTHIMIVALPLFKPFLTLDTLHENCTSHRKSHDGLDLMGENSSTHPTPNTL